MCPFGTGFPRNLAMTLELPIHGLVNILIEVILMITSHNLHAARVVIRAQVISIVGRVRDA